MHTRGCLISQQPQRGWFSIRLLGISNGTVDRRSSGGLDSEVLGVHVCYSFLEDGGGLDERALRRSGVTFGAHLEARNMECCCCFGLFAADLQEIANSRSANGDPGLGFCKRFARNGALSNGNSGNPS